MSTCRPANWWKTLNLSNASFSNVNMSNLKIENAEVAGMMINGIRLSDLFQAYETAKTAGGN